MFKDRLCTITGQTKHRFDIDVRYALLMDSAGNPHRLVVEDKSCAPLSQLVGQIVAARVARKDYKIGHSDGARWYVSSVKFTLGEPVVAAMVGDKDRKICKRAEPILGSRTKMTRTCRTAAEWQAFGSDRDQLRRDIRNKVKGDSVTD